MSHDHRPSLVGMPARRIDDQRLGGAWVTSPHRRDNRRTCISSAQAPAHVDDDRGRNVPFPVSTRQRSPMRASPNHVARYHGNPQLPPPRLPEQAQIAVVKRMHVDVGPRHVPSGRLPRSPRASSGIILRISSPEITPTPPRPRTSRIRHAPCRTGPRGHQRDTSAPQQRIGRKALWRRVEKGGGCPRSARICAGP